MAWTIPMTAVANEVWSAAQFNTHVRDNLNETEVAKVTAAGQYPVGVGANSLTVRTASAVNNTASGTTTSLTYTGTLSGSPGTNPSITATTGTKALVHIASVLQNSALNGGTVLSCAVSGASTVAAADDWSIYADGRPASQVPRHGGWHMFTGLTPGSNTFTLQYRVNVASTATYQNRHLIVVPF